MPATLGTLPPELLAAVVSYMQRPSDLKSLCLVSKLLRAVATSNLYRDIILDPSLKGANEGFFTMCHSGHQHIRSLTFTPLELNGIDTESAQEAVRYALLLLPRDNLNHISMPLEMPLDNHTLATLCTQQKALEAVKLGSMTGGLPQLAHLVRAWLPELRQLDTADTVTEGDLDFCSNVIRSCTHLSRLGVRLNHWSEETAPEVASHGLHDSFLHNGVAFEKLFGHINTENGTTDDERKGLDDLWFEETDLSYSDRTFSRVIQFEVLQFLHLYECPGASVLLQELSKQFKERGSRLRGFICLSHEDDEESNAGAVQDFLRSFSGLEYFQLTESMSGTGFDLGCLSNHISTLAELYIGMGTNDDDGGHWCASPRDLQSLRQFPRLRQLALAMPQPVLPVTAGRQWDEYWINVEHLAQLPALTILRFLTWPKGPALYKLSENDLFKDLYRRDIDDLASHIFTRLKANTDSHTARLSVLCIGDSFVEDTVRTEEGAEWIVDGCMCYTVGTVTDRFGFRSLTAIRTERKLVKYVEPVFDVFSEFDKEHDFGMGTGTYWNLSG